MADCGSKTMSIPLFYGKNKNFVMWWIQFKAYKKVQKFHQALEVTPETNLPVRQNDAEHLDCANGRNKTAVDAMDQNK
jgi:hypothetical protein